MHDESKRQNPRLSPSWIFISRASDFLLRGRTIVAFSRGESPMNGEQKRRDPSFNTGANFLSLIAALVYRCIA